MLVGNLYRDKCELYCCEHKLRAVHNYHVFFYLMNMNLICYEFINVLQT